MSYVAVCNVNLSRHNYFLANKNLLFYRCLFVYIIKRTLHGGLKIWILFSSGKTIFYERAQRVSKILFLLRENKIHIFAPPFNILYIQCFTMHGKLVIEQEDFFTESLSKENYYLSSPLPVYVFFFVWWLSYNRSERLSV